MTYLINHHYAQLFIYTTKIEQQQQTLTTAFTKLLISVVEVSFPQGNHPILRTC